MLLSDIEGVQEGCARLYDFADFLILTDLNVSSHMHPVAVVLEGSASKPPLGGSPMDRNDFSRHKKHVCGRVSCQVNHDSGTRV